MLAPSTPGLCCWQVDHVKAERNVLAEVHNPHVVRLFYSFQARLMDAPRCAGSRQYCLHHEGQLNLALLQGRSTERLPEWSDFHSWGRGI